MTEGALDDHDCEDADCGHAHAYLAWTCGSCHVALRPTGAAGTRTCEVCGRWFAVNPYADEDVGCQIRDHPVDTNASTHQRERCHPERS